MFEQTFKNIDDVLWKEAGCATELDYAEQTSWILFLKYLDDLEKANQKKRELEDKEYEYILEKRYRWAAWAAPKKRDGSFDHDKALTGDDLIEFVNRDLFPYLQGFRTRATGANTIEYKIGEIFGEIKNKFQSGYSLRDGLELVDALSFKTQAQKHELSELYEDGPLGEQWLRTFQDNEKTIPTILTTSQKLSTGVDARNVRNIVLMRPIGTMIEFKQIIGRGTRLFDGKDYHHLRLREGL